MIKNIPIFKKIEFKIGLLMRVNRFWPNQTSARTTASQYLFSPWKLIRIGSVREVNDDLEIRS